MNNITLIIKPTHQCCAACVYCSAYNAVRDKEANFMSLETLRNLMRRFSEYADTGELKSLIFTWHGGEPLLVENDFYELAMELQREHLVAKGVQVSNIMQSNLLLLTDEKAKMLKKLILYHDGTPASIGTSYDPIPGIRNMPGGDYLSRWWQSIEIMKRHGIRYGIVYTVHKKSLDNVDLIFNTFRERMPESSVRFNAIYAEGRASLEATKRFLITPEEWGRFMVDYYRLWEASGREQRYSPFREYYDFHHNGQFEFSCESAGGCHTTHLGIEVDGSVYCCGRGIEESSRCYGNVNRDSIAGILNSPFRQAIGNRMVQLEIAGCRNCEWWQYCHGGCPVDSLITYGNLTQPTNWCRAKKYFLETVFGSPRKEETPVRQFSAYI